MQRPAHLHPQGRAPELTPGTPAAPAGPAAAAGPGPAAAPTRPAGSRTPGDAHPPHACAARPGYAGVRTARRGRHAGGTPGPRRRPSSTPAVGAETVRPEHPEASGSPPKRDCPDSPRSPLPADGNTPRTTREQPPTGHQPRAPDRPLTGNTPSGAARRGTGARARAEPYRPGPADGPRQDTSAHRPTPNPPPLGARRAAPRAHAGAAPNLDHRRDRNGRLPHPASRSAHGDRADPHP